MTIPTIEPVMYFVDNKSLTQLPQSTNEVFIVILTKKERRQLIARQD